MAGLIALMGGGEFRDECRDMDGALLRMIGAPRPRVVIVPTAAGSENPAMAARNGVRHFQALGAAASAAMILTSEDARNETLLAPLADAELIYLTGGRPGYLLEALRATPSWEAVVERYRAGALVAGSSAGAMVLAERMRDPQRGTVREALGLVPGVAVLAHRESASVERVQAVRESLGDELTLLEIDTATACVSTGEGRWEVLGVGRVGVSRAGEIASYGPGETFALA